MQQLSDTVSYIVFRNPITTGLVDIARKTGYVKPKPQEIPVQVLQTMQRPLCAIIGSSSHIIRMAGLSGAGAVMLGAYGSHKEYPEPETGKKDLRRIFETANRFHFIHTLALLGTPLCRCPKLSATFLTIGMILFCGTCYHHAFTGERKYGRLAPAGGLCLILGWLIMVY